MNNHWPGFGITDEDLEEKGEGQAEKQTLESRKLKWLRGEGLGVRGYVLSVER